MVQILDRRVHGADCTRSAANQRQRLDQSDFYEAVAEGQVEEVIITADSIGYEIRGKLHSDDSVPGGQSIRNFTTYVLKHEELPKRPSGCT